MIHTFNINNSVGYIQPNAVKEQLKDKLVFVIGVKNKGCSLENLLKSYPQIKVIHKFPETPNVNYLYYPEEHMLQPAIVTWKD